MKKIWFWFKNKIYQISHHSYSMLIIGLLIGLIFGGIAGFSLSHPKANKNDKIGIYPSIFMTGSDGEISTIDPMVEGLTKMKNARPKRGLQFIVNSDNSLKISGKIEKNNHYPTIEIGMVDGTDNSNKVEAAIIAVLNYLQSHYKVEYYNMLGFSAGGTGVYRYLINHSTDRTLPEVKKWVSLDGQYNASTPLSPGETLDEVLKNGPKNKTKYYLTEENIFHKFDPRVQVAMLAGVYDEAKQTDGVVPWADTFSIYHLLVENGNAVSRFMAKGDNTNHADMPKNKQAIEFVYNFFYQ